MPSKKLRITVYLDTDEFEYIREVADSTGLSLSTFAKRVCLGQKVKNLEYVYVRHALYLLKGDLGRIGGLLKQFLASGLVDKHRIYRNLGELDAIKTKIEAAVDRVHDCQTAAPKG
jgi:hypothetical protein